MPHISTLPITQPTEPSVLLLPDVLHLLVTGLVDFLARVSVVCCHRGVVAAAAVAG